MGIFWESLKHAFPESSCERQDFSMIPGPKCVSWDPRFIRVLGSLSILPLQAWSWEEDDANMFMFRLPSSRVSSMTKAGLKCRLILPASSIDQTHLSLFSIPLQVFPLSTGTLYQPLLCPFMSAEYAALFCVSHCPWPCL